MWIKRKSDYTQKEAVMYSGTDISMPETTYSHYYEIILNGKTIQNEPPSLDTPCTITSANNFNLISEDIALDNITANIAYTLSGIKIDGPSANEHIYADYIDYKNALNENYFADQVIVTHNAVTYKQKIKKIIFNGTQDWAYMTTQTDTYRFQTVISDLYIMVDGNTLCCKSNRFTARKYNDLTGPAINLEGIATRNNNTTAMITINKSRLAEGTSTAIRNWFSANPTEFYYVLKTPIYTDITNTATGQALLNLRTFDGFTRLYDDSGMSLWKIVKVF